MSMCSLLHFAKRWLRGNFTLDPAPLDLDALDLPLTVGATVLIV